MKDLVETDAALIASGTLTVVDTDSDEAFHADTITGTYEHGGPMIVEEDPDALVKRLMARPSIGRASRSANPASGYTR